MGEALFDARGLVNEGRRGRHEGWVSQGWVSPETESIRLSIVPLHTYQGSGPLLPSSHILKEQPGGFFDSGRRVDSALPAPRLSKSLDVFLA